jgi:hypothetical protein
MSVKQPRTRKFMAHEPGFTIIDAMNRLFPAWFDGESWDGWRGHLDHLLPKQSKLARGHHAAMPYEHVAAFVGRLRENDSLTAQALELTILTAARSGETAYGGPSSISIKGFGHCPRGRMKGDVSTVCRSPSVRRRSDPATWSGDRLSNRGIDIAHQYG